MLVLIKIFAWEQLTGVFKAREEKISNDIDGAEAAREKAEALAAKRQEELAGARTEQHKLLMMPKKQVKIKRLKSLQKHVKKQAA